MVLNWIVDSRNLVELAVFFSQLTKTRIYHSNFQPWKPRTYLPRPLILPEQTTNSPFALSSITGYEQPVNTLHLTQATSSPSTSSTLLPLPVGTTNTAGLDLTIGKRLIGTAGDSGVQDRLQNEERFPHTSTARGEQQQQTSNNNNNPEQQQQSRTTTTTPNNNNNPEQQQTPNNNNPQQQTPKTVCPTGPEKSRTL